MPFRIRAPCVPRFPGGRIRLRLPRMLPIPARCRASRIPCPVRARRRPRARSSRTMPTPQPGRGDAPSAHVQPKTKKEPGKTIRVPCIWPGGGVSRRTFPNLCAGGDEAKDAHGIPVTNPAHPCLRAQPRLENLYAPRVALPGNPSAGAAPETPLRTAAETAGPSARHRCGGGTLASRSYASITHTGKIAQIPGGPGFRQGVQQGGLPHFRIIDAGSGILRRSRTVIPRFENRPRRLAGERFRKGPRLNDLRGGSGQRHVRALEIDKLIPRHHVSPHT